MPPAATFSSFSALMRRPPPPARRLLLVTAARAHSTNEASRARGGLPRFHSPSLPSSKGEVVRIQGDEFWHMTRVLRLGINDSPIEGCIQCVKLWEEIESINRDDQVPDKFTWKGAASGNYSARDTYRMLCQGSIRYSMYKPIWRSLAPLKCKLFSWLALRYRLWTSDRRFRHGLQAQTDACFTCLQEEDKVDHI